RVLSCCFEWFEHAGHEVTSGPSRPRWRLARSPLGVGVASRRTRGPEAPDASCVVPGPGPAPLRGRATGTLSPGGRLSGFLLADDFLGIASPGDQPRPGRICGCDEVGPLCAVVVAGLL